MTRYISKLQYKTYETSEFTSIAPRTFEEVMELIHNFPWEAERPLTPVGLTGPSVTIEDGFGNYLKLGLYYNQKFRLYFYTNQQKLYIANILKIEESEEVISQFFNGRVSLKNFKLESSFVSQTAHFVTNDFKYTSNFERNISFIFSPAIWYAGFFLILTIYRLLSSNSSTVFNVALIYFAAINLRLMPRYILGFKYWTYCESKMLSVSKGNDIFHYGYSYDYKTYSKQDIKEINVYSKNRNRSSLRGYAFYEIIFNNNEVIKFPSLLIDEDLFLEKFAKANPNIIPTFFPSLKNASKT